MCSLSREDPVFMHVSAPRSWEVRSFAWPLTSYCVYAQVEVEKKIVVLDMCTASLIYIHYLCVLCASTLCLAVNSTKYEISRFCYRRCGEVVSRCEANSGQYCTMTKPSLSKVNLTQRDQPRSLVDDLG